MIPFDAAEEPARPIIVIAGFTESLLAEVIENALAVLTQLSAKFISIPAFQVPVFPTASPSRWILPVPEFTRAFVHMVIPARQELVPVRALPRIDMSPPPE